MLPLNDLASLSEEYAKQNAEKKELERKLAEIETEQKIAECTRAYITEFETQVMNAVKQGKKFTNIYIVSEELKKEQTFARFNHIERTAAERLIFAIEKQGFGFSEPTERMKEAIYSYMESFGSINIGVNWADLRPNTDYNPPDYTAEINRLKDKMSRLKELNEKADKIIAE